MNHPPLTRLIAPLTALGVLLLPAPAQNAGFLVDYSTGDLIRFSLAAPASQVTVGPCAKFVEGLEFAGGVLYALRDTGALDVVDHTSGSSTSVGTLAGVAGHIWTGLAYDETTGTMYASSTDGVDDSSIYTVDLDTATATLVATASGDLAFVDIGIDPAGTMYALDLDGNQLHTVDQTTGAATLVGSTGYVGTGPWHGMDFRSGTGQLFLATHDGITNANDLRSVDLETGAASVVGPVGHLTGSLAIPTQYPLAYCTPGTSASGCQALLSAAGTPSASTPTGFTLMAGGVEGQKDGLFFFAANGRQANPWGNGTSFQCVAPPVQRAGLLTGSGNVGLCDGAFAQDLNARWTAKPAQNPGAGAVVQAQLWYRDPQSTSNQTTSLSDALEFLVMP